LLTKQESSKNSLPCWSKLQNQLGLLLILTTTEVILKKLLHSLRIFIISICELFRCLTYTLWFKISAYHLWEWIFWNFWAHTPLKKLWYLCFFGTAPLHIQN